MGIYVDLALAAVLVIFIIVSAKRGFMLSLLEVVAFILAIFLALKCCMPLGKTLYARFFEEKTVQKMTEALPLRTSGRADELIESLPGAVKRYAQKTSSGELDELAGQLSELRTSQEAAAKLLNERVVRPIAVSLLASASFLVLGLLLTLIFRLLAKLLGKLFRKRLVGKVNAFLGGLLGLVKGVIVCYFICLALTTLAPYFGSENFEAAVNASVLTSLVRSFSPSDLFKI